MKFTAFAAALLGIVLISSCKTGQDDPAISLRSRDKKVTGTWTLKSFKSEEIANSTEITTNDVTTDEAKVGTTSTKTTEFDGSKLSFTSVKM